MFENVIFFKEDTHQYFNKLTNEEYQSVSHVIDEYKDHFDADKMSKLVAKKKGMSQEEVLKEWDQIRDFACDRGTNLHEALENFIKFGEVDKNYKKVIESYINCVSKIINENELKQIYSEILFYNHDTKIAGTSDICWVHNDETFTIGDFKTNKKFRYFSEYKNWMKYPISHLMECEFNKYTIQLSLYAYMCEVLTNKKCRGLIILYLNPDTGKFEPIHCNYLKHEIIMLLRDYKKHHQK